jgi:hypothetical protein
VSRPPNDFTYKNRLVFDSNSYLPELKFHSTYEITNVLENSSIYDNEKVVGNIRNVTHRNASLFYGDFYLCKEYPEDCNIVDQIICFNVKDMSFRIKSYIRKEEDKNG